MVVWRFDRLGRSLRHLIDTVTALAERKVGFRSLTENIDTTTSGGKLVFHIFGALADFERELIRERTVAGLAAARARGRHGGRPTVMPPDKVATARQMYDSKQYTVEAIARVLGVSRASIYRHLADAGPGPAGRRGRWRRGGPRGAGTPEAATPWRPAQLSATSRSLTAGSPSTSSGIGWAAGAT